MSSMMIALDGPAGAGKGTLARHLAQIYDLDFLDTGLLYRAVAYKIKESGKTNDEIETARKISCSLELKDLRNPSLRDEDIGNLASKIAADPEVRLHLVVFQRTFAHHPTPGKQGVVLDGRDIGTQILPKALCKIYVTASPEVRATRRLKELHQKGIDCIFETVLEDIKARDARDQRRKASPLHPAKDALILDTSELKIDEVVQKACLFVDLKYPKALKMTSSSLE